MCGVSAIVNFQADGPLTGVLARMHGLLAHRGPDGEGLLWADSEFRPQAIHGKTLPFPELPHSLRFAAGFRWLKIQDLDEHANQPMACPEQKHWLLFNGEIYNHGELRVELESKGFSFRTRSDTEVLLAAYRAWGNDTWPRLRGMWAALLFDIERRKLVVSRDRLGIKPLFYSLDKQRLLFASEAKAVALARSERPEADLHRAHEFLRGFPPQSSELSFFSGVLPVPAGTWAEIDLNESRANKPAFRPYWNLADFRSRTISESEFESTRSNFEALLKDCVDEHVNAAVNVGTLLSGGLDTSMLARLLAQRAQRFGASAPNAYSIIFEDPAMSEWPYQQLVLAQGGLRGHRHLLKADEAWNTAGDVIWAQGQPLLGQDIIAQYHAYRLAKQQNSVVVLDGQGADELLAGMPLYEAQIFPELLMRGRLPTFAKELRLRMQRYGYGPRRALNVYLAQPLLRRWQERRGLPHYSWLDRSLADSSRFGPGRTGDWGGHPTALSRYLFRHVRHTNLPQVLLLQDHASMAHGIESRVPFLDHRLVEYVFQLPDQFKVGRGVRKRILLETARSYLPKAVVERRDKRVFVSDITWMKLREKRAAALREMASSSDLRSFPLIDGPKMAKFVSGYLAGEHQDEMAVWRLYTFWLWQRLFCKESTA